MKRRKFLKVMGMAGAAAIVPWRFDFQQGWQQGAAYAAVNSPGLPLWGTTLRGVGPGGIPVAATDALPAPVTGVSHYTMDISQFSDVIAPVGVDYQQTLLWGYDPVVPLGGGVQPQKHLGGIIIGNKGTPLQITFRNNLPDLHPLPVDISLPGANAAKNRAAVHLHGGHIHWFSDGGPFDWWTPTGATGLSFLNNTILNPGALVNEAEYFYINDQFSRLMWYHDHAHGTTRLNAYAGLATAYLLRDSFEASLIGRGLPPFIETSVLAGQFPRELPLVIQDKIFVGSNINILDPNWGAMGLPTTPGSLWYAHMYDPKVFKLDKKGRNLATLPVPSAVPEFFGDTMLVNGTVFPRVQVEARRYRLRILNACNSRFVNLQLFEADLSPDGITLNPKTLVPRNLPYTPAAGTNLRPNSCLLLGTEGGFLPKPVDIPLNLPINPVTLKGSLVLAPAERADIIIDFTGYAGKKLILYNDAPGPFPGGAPIFDFLPNGTGAGPNTRELLRFDVVPVSGTPDLPLTITPATDLTAGNDPFLTAPGGPLQGLGIVGGQVNVALFQAAGIKVRQLTLNEAFDIYGRLAQLIGTNQLNPQGGGFGLEYLQPATELPIAGSVEIWQIANLSADTHPIHFHLVNVQVIARQPMNINNYKGTPAFTGPARLPDPDETGWKETVRMHPAEVITVAMKFDLPANPPNISVIPTSPRTGGHEYVYHCHILEHEEHDMMRPLVVI